MLAFLLDYFGAQEESLVEPELHSGILPCVYNYTMQSGRVNSAFTALC